MKIKYVTGNLFVSDVEFIAHCCNSHGKMGSGFAKELRERYPGAYDAYRETYEARRLEMGSVVSFHAEDGRTIYNIIGQKNYGYDGARYVSYDALANALEELDAAAQSRGMDHLAMPLMGAGLAGGKWPIIKSIIEEHSKNYQPIVFLLEGAPLPDGINPLQLD